MMTPKKLFFAAIAASVLLACSNEKTDGPAPGPGETKSVPVSFELSINGANATRASFPSPEALENELHVTNVVFFVFNNQRIFETYKHLDYVRTGGSTTGKAHFDLELPVGRHYAFAVANVPKSYLNYDLDGKTIEQFSKEIFDYDIYTLTGGGFFDELPGSDEQIAEESRGFFMTTENGFVEFLAVDTDALADAPSRAANKVELELGRAVAKVAVAFDAPQTSSAQPNGLLTNVEYMVDNNPKTMYVVPSYNGSALITPNYDYTFVSANRYQDPLEGYKPAISGTPDKYNDFTYCMENSNFVPKQGSATVVMVKGNFVPWKLHDADGTESSTVTDPSTPVDFWMIADVVNGKRYYNADKYYNTESIDPGQFDSQKTQEVVKFEKGLSYYPVWLRNPKSGNENQYTVKRNSYYMVNITSVSGVGEPDPDGGIDPQEPLDKEVNIKVEITVADWNPIEDEQGL